MKFATAIAHFDSVSLRSRPPRRSPRMSGSGTQPQVLPRPLRRDPLHPLRDPSVAETRPASADRCAPAIRLIGSGSVAGPHNQCQRRPPPRIRYQIAVPVVSKTTVRLYPPDIEIIDAWAAANPDPDTGLTPSRPTAIRRMIRVTAHAPQPTSPDRVDPPATRTDLDDAVSTILGTLRSTHRTA